MERRFLWVTVAASLLAGLFGTAAYSATSDADAGLNSAIKDKCKSRPGIAVEVANAPGQILEVFCDYDLRAKGCRPLGYIRNYLLYTRGLCLNGNELYGTAFFSTSRCRTAAEQAANNRDVYNNRVPDSVWRMIKLIRNIELQKNCLNANEVE